MAANLWATFGSSGPSDASVLRGFAGDGNTVRVARRVDERINVATPMAEMQSTSHRTPAGGGKDASAGVCSPRWDTALLWPRSSVGQQSAHRIAVVPPSDPVAILSATGPNQNWRFTELNRLGYTEGKNLILVERYSGEGRADT
jgi:hypothetical protein